MFFYFFLNNTTGLQHINIQISSIAYLMNRKNYCWAESGFLMRPRFRVGFGLTSSGSGRVRVGFGLNQLGPIPSLLHNIDQNLELPQCFLLQRNMNPYSKRCFRTTHRHSGVNATDVGEAHKIYFQQSIKSFVCLLTVPYK